MGRELMTVQQCAEEARNSVAFWRKLTGRRGITVVRVGRSLRIPRAAFEEFLRAGTRPALKPVFSALAATSTYDNC